MFYNDKTYQTLLTSHRRFLHRIPELDRNLPKTNEYILSVLNKLNCTISFPYDSAICAFFDKGKHDTIAFRADTDALPLDEINDIDFKSVHKGQMHACGHDGHMAIALTLAQYIDTVNDCNHNVLIIFQPAEETLGGAFDICKSNILKKFNVTATLGLHLWPFLPAGKIGSRPGAFMAQSAEVNLDVFGKSAHGTSPYEGLDALFIASDLITSIYKAHALRPGAVARFSFPHEELPFKEASSPDLKTVINFGKASSGHARNIVSEHTRIEGTVRAFSEKNFSEIITLINEVSNKLSKTYNCNIEVSNSEGYPPIINDTDLFKKLTPMLDTLEEGFEEMSEPLMIADDFSFYGKEAPAIYFMLGTGTGVPLHSANFNFDEKILLSGLELFIKSIDAI